MDKSAIIRALRESAQSVSGGIADAAVGDNVDIVSGALRYAGLPIPENPMGGKQWLRESGLVKDNPGLGNQLAYAAGNVPTMLMQIPQTAVYLGKAVKEMIPK